MLIKVLQEEKSHNYPNTKGDEYSYTFLRTTSVNIGSVISKTNSRSSF